MNLLRTVSPEVVSASTKHGSCFSVICVVINYNIRVKFHGICLRVGIVGSEIHSCNYIDDLLTKPRACNFEYLTLVLFFRVPDLMVPNRTLLLQFRCLQCLHVCQSVRLTLGQLFMYFTSLCWTSLTLVNEDIV